MAGPYFQIEGGAEKKRLDFPPGAAELFIGRSPECQLVIASGAVSRRHARVRCDGAEVTIEDLGSSNGTFVNGTRLAEPHALRDRDRVALGSVQLTFVMPAEARPEPSAMDTLHDEPAATVFVPKPAAEPPPPKPAAEPPQTAAMPKPAAAPPPTVAAAKPEERAPETVFVPKPAATPPPPPKREETVFVPKPAATPPAAAPSPATPETVYAPRPSAPPVPAAPPAEPRRPAMSTATVKPSARALEAAAPPEVKFAPTVSGPSVLELAVIALGSFLAVYAVGALLIRFVF